MYDMKVLSPYLKDIETPKNMYEMNNLTFRKDVLSGNSANQSLLLIDKVDVDSTLPTEEQAYTQACELITCQKRLLSVLDRVEVHLEAICKMVNTLEGNEGNFILPCVKKGHQEQQQQYSNEKNDFSDIELVINVHPSQAPYALIYLNILWKNIIFLNIETYLHSSIKMIATEPTSKEYQQIAIFEKYLTKIGSDLANITSKRISILIIWKQCNKLTMSKNENGKVITISNETNILRYISRLISPQKFQYNNCSNFMDCNEIDKILDICDDLRCKSDDNNYCNKLLKTLSLILKQKGNLYFSGSNCELADVSVFSVLTQYSDKFIVKNFPDNFANWHKRLQTELKVNF